MRILIPSPLRSYTGGKEEVQAMGATLKEVLFDLDQSFPGFRFRIIDEQDQIRTHIKVFVNQEQETELSRELQPTDTIHVICSLSGG